MKIVFIHGRSQEKKSPADLQKQWTDALYEGMRRAALPEPKEIDIVFPYYGDDLFKETDKADREAFRILMDRGAAAASPPAEELAFTQDILREMAHSKGITDEEMATEVWGSAIDRGVSDWPGALSALRLLGRVPGITAACLILFLRDTWYYLTKNGLRVRVNQIVGQGIPEEGPCVVVAHSLGSIVGYNLLMDRRSRNNIGSFITLGSPLGIEAIYSRLPSGPSTRKAPDGVAGWFNARDPHDVVALHEIPASRFSGKPIVQNYSEVVNRSDNQHGIEDYLRDRTVARAIHDAIHL